MRSLRNIGGLVVPGRFRFREPDESRTFASVRELVDFVLAYREANGVPVESREALQVEIEDWLCNQIGSPEYYCFEDGKPMPLKDHTGLTVHGTGYQGQHKWKELHEWAANLSPEASVEEAKAWLESFAGSLPCGDCRREWKRLVSENPPSLEGTADQIWVWTFERHNDVRRRLGQEEMGISQAYSIIKGPPPEGTEWNPAYIKASLGTVFQNRKI